MKGWYLDTSAVLKLLVEEAESAALRKFVGSTLITSEFTRLEVARAVKLFTPQMQKAFSQLLGSFSIITLNSTVLTQSELIIGNSELRAPDAIQVASALQISKSSLGLITYDKKMISVAQKLGLRVESPR